MGIFQRGDIMAAISGVSNTPNVSPVMPPQTGRASSTARPSAAAVESVIVSLGNSKDSALTYNASGLVGAPAQGNAAKAANPTPAQAAQEAVLAAQSNVTQAMNSITSGASGQTEDTGPFSGMAGGQGLFSPKAMQTLVGEGPFSKKDAEKMSVGNFPPGAIAQTQSATAQAKEALKASTGA